MSKTDAVTGLWKAILNTLDDAAAQSALSFEDIRREADEAVTSWRLAIDRREGRNGRTLQRAIASARLRHEDQELLHRPAAETFNLSVRSRKALYRLNVRTIREMANLTADDLLALNGVGETTLNEIRDAMASVGMALDGMATPANDTNS